MTGRELIACGFYVRVQAAPNEAGSCDVFYSERGLQQVRGNNGEFPQVPSHTVEVRVRIHDDGVQVVRPKNYRDITLTDFEEDARSRVRLVSGWLGRLSTLINDVESWVKDLGWSTRRIEKSMDDLEIGRYTAPSLLMQEGTDRILLEPITRSGTGTDGVVDLYLMPAYDDIASLYHEDGRWNVHYMFSGTAAANTKEAPAKPLNKTTLQEVLAEMKQHAA